MGKITDEIASIIMGLSATQSNREIEATLASQGIKLSRTAVGNFIKANRKERSEQTREVVNEHIKKTVITDLDILEDMRNQLDRYRKDPELRISQKLQCIDRLNKVIDTRLKYSGAGEPDESKSTNITVNLFDPEQRKKLLRDALND